MESPRPPIPAHRKRIYWGLMLLLCVGMVWLFAQFAFHSAFLGWWMSPELKPDKKYEALCRKYDEAINQFNKSYSLQNTYGFTDVNHPYEAPDSLLRIAILGDSYIWGDGLHFSQTWNHQLADRLNLDYTNVEVLHWGRNGWNYPDHRRWIVEEGKKFKVDLVLLAWCFNDMFGEGHDSLSRFQKTYAGDTFLRSFQRYVCQPQRVKAYLQSLVAIRDTLAKRNIRFVVFLASHPPLGLTYEKALLRREFIANGIDFYDPTSLLRVKLSGGPKHNSILDISPANGHSGAIVNYFKADAALLWLKSQPLMAKARPRLLPSGTLSAHWEAQ